MFLWIPYDKHHHNKKNQFCFYWFWFLELFVKSKIFKLKSYRKVKKGQKKTFNARYSRHHLAIFKKVLTLFFSFPLKLGKFHQWFS